jgi:hypothetical protein
MSKTISKAELVQLLEDKRVEAIPFLVTGGSMAPFLIGGRDTVFLKKFDELKKVISYYMNVAIIN